MPQNLFAKYGRKGFCGKFEGSEGRWRLNEATGEVSPGAGSQGVQKGDAALWRDKVSSVHRA
jgi:hypothetical protein